MVMKRIAAILQAKTNRTLDRLEDPREMLDLGYERQVELLRDVKRGVVEVTAARRRLQLQAEEVRAQSAKLEQQARAALAAGRDDLARLALERRQAALGQMADFEAQVAGLQAEQDRLVAAESRLQAKIEAFRTRKEVLKAQYTAAKATARVGEAVTGLSEEMADVGMAIQRAEDRTAQLRSRGDAIAELIESGVLEDQLDPGTSPLDRELAQLGANYAVEAELDAMRQELAQANPVRLLEAKQ